MRRRLEALVVKPVSDEEQKLRYEVLRFNREQHIHGRGRLEKSSHATFKSYDTLCQRTFLRGAVSTLCRHSRPLVHQSLVGATMAITE